MVFLLFQLEEFLFLKESSSLQVSQHFLVIMLVLFVPVASQVALREQVLAQAAVAVAVEVQVSKDERLLVEKMLLLEARKI